MESALRLFKALPVTRHTPAARLNVSLAMHTLQNGFVFDPSVTAEYSTPGLADAVNRLYGRNPDQMNAAFHKSFAKVRDASLVQLALEQVLHYMTTYGGWRDIASPDGVFIPREVLNSPELEEGLRLVVIRGLTKDELKVELLALLSSGVALSEQTVNDAVEVAKLVELTEADLTQVRNKEVRAALYEHLGILPSRPEEFLRFLVQQATGKSLLIKNRATVDALRDSDASLNKFLLSYDPAKLATIFYRYKPLFLALRKNPAAKEYINRVRRLAVQHHEPMRPDLLNSLTAKLTNQELVTFGELEAALSQANTFRKVRLAYALRFRTRDADSILYRIRNGKSYATSFNAADDLNIKVAMQAVFKLVMNSIVNDLRAKVDGKRVFIPEGLKYALPATEKQFTGTLPSGSYVQTTPTGLWAPADDMVVGVHWENLPDWRVDLDLSVSNAGGKVGWDGSYRGGDGNILFSGDVTDAPPAFGGATEAFHIGHQARGAWLVNLNYYNIPRSGVEAVPFQIFVGRESRGNVKQNYVVDPNKLVAMSYSAIDVRQKTLGIIAATDRCARFYFAESAFGNAVSSRHGEAAEHARKYLLDYYTDAIVLNDGLVAAGAQLVSSPEDADIDLSFEAIDKTTFLNLLS